MSAYTPPSLDKEPSDRDTRLRFTKRAHAAIAARCGAVAAATKAVSPPFSPPPSSPLFLPPPLHLPSPNAVLLLPLIAKTDPTRGLQPRESPCRIYYEVAAL